MTEQDVNKILKNRYSEVPESTRRELAQDDLHAELAAACESVGIKTYQGMCAGRICDKVKPFESLPEPCPILLKHGQCPDECKHLVQDILPIPELLEQLEGWLKASFGSRSAWIEVTQKVLGINPLTGWRKTIYLVLTITQEQRIECAIATVKNWRGWDDVL